MSGLSIHSTPIRASLNGMAGATGQTPTRDKQTAFEERFALAALLTLCPVAAASAGVSKSATPMGVAEELLRQYGSIGRLLALAVREQCYDSLPENVSEFLRVIHRAMSLSLRSSIESRPILQNRAQLRDYLHFDLAHSDIEQVRLIHMNTRNVIIADELHSVGTVSRVAVYVREIAKRAIATGATALIVVHNHPSGDVSISGEDITAFRQIKTALDALEISLHDFIIVGSGGFRSFREDQIF